MSADYSAGPWRGYEREGRIYVCRADEPGFALTWREFRDLQELMRDWRAEQQRRERLAKVSKSGGRKCPECGHRTSVHRNGNGFCSASRCACEGFEGEALGVRAAS